MGDIKARGLALTSLQALGAKLPVCDWIPKTFVDMTPSAPLLTIPTGQNQMSTQCVVDTQKCTGFSNPIDRLYMFVAPHDPPGGIYLFTAPYPLGPWTMRPGAGQRGEVFSREMFGLGSIGTDHVSSPDAHWVPEESRWRIYFHACGKDGYQAVTGVGYQRSYVAYTADGLTNVTFGGKILPEPIDDYQYNSQETAYIKCIHQGLEWAAIIQSSDLIAAPSGSYGLYTAISLAYSSDGGNNFWYSMKNPILAGVLTDNEAILMFPAPLVINDTLYIFYNAFNAPETGIWLATYDRGLLIRYGLVFGKPASGWNSGRLGFPSPLIYQNKLWLFYCAGNRTDNPPANWPGTNVGVTCSSSLPEVIS